MSHISQEGAGGAGGAGGERLIKDHKRQEAARKLAAMSAEMASMTAEKQDSEPAPSVEPHVLKRAAKKESSIHIIQINPLY